MKLNARVHGKGQPLIVMHGLFGMSDNWNTLGKQWADELHRSVHLLDMRNHGRSDWDSPHTYHAMSEDIAQYIKENGMEKAAILGHSMGGKAAMFFATLNPDKVDKLLIADIAPKHYPVHHQDIIDALDYVRQSKPESRNRAQELLGEKINNDGIAFFLLKSLHRRKDGIYDWRFNFEQIKRDIDKVGEALPPPAIYEGPTLFLRGNKSNYITDEDVPYLDEHFPDVQLATIEGAGHWLHAEKPKVFSENVENFLRQ